MPDAGRIVALAVEAAHAVQELMLVIVEGVMVEEELGVAEVGVAEGVVNNY
jgi:hypothetical protein